MGLLFFGRNCVLIGSIDILDGNYGVVVCDIILGWQLCSSWLCGGNNAVI